MRRLRASWTASLHILSRCSDYIYRKVARAFPRLCCIRAPFGRIPLTTTALPLILRLVFATTSRDLGMLMGRLPEWVLQFRHLPQIATPVSAVLFSCLVFGAPADDSPPDSAAILPIVPAPSPSPSPGVDWKPL